MHSEPGAVEADALLLYHHPLIGFDALEPAFLAELETRSLLRGGQFLDLTFAKRVAVMRRRPRGDQPDRAGLGGGGRRRRSPLSWRRPRRANATIDTASGYQVMGHPGIAPNGYADYSYRRKLSPRAHVHGEPAVEMAERVDVCIVGSGLRRLDLGLPAGRALPGRGPGRRASSCSSAGARHQHTDFRQSMDIEHLSRIYGLVQGQGAQVVIGDGVGGGSNLYLAASLRSPSETFERRDHRPDDGPDRRMWPSQISRATLDPYYARAEAGAARAAPDLEPGREVGRPVGERRSTPPGYTCDRVPLAIDLDRCIQAKWCHTGCIFAAKNSVITNYLAVGRGASGVRGAAQLAGGADRAERRAPVPLRRQRLRDRQRQRRPDAAADRQHVRRSSARC